MRELWLKIAHASGARIYGLLAAMASLVITARWLGPEGRGAFAAATTWSLLFATFGSLSLGQVAIHRASQRRDQSWLGDTLAALLALTAAITVVSWTVAAVMYLVSRGGAFGHLQVRYLVLGFLMLPFVVWEQFGSSLLTAVDRLDIYNRWQVVGRTLGLLVIVAAAASRWGVEAALAATLLTQACVSLGGLRFLIRRAEGGLRTSWATVRELLTGGVKLHLNAIGSYLILSTDVLFIDHYRGHAETGYYQLASQLIGTMLIIPQAAAVVLFGKVAQVGAEEAWPFVRKSLLGLTGLMIAGSLVAALASPLLIPLVAGKAFAPAIPAFRLLLPALVGMTVSSLLAPQWIGRGLFLAASGMTIFFGLLNLAASFLFVPRHGMFGSIYATLLTYACSVLINGAMAVKWEREWRRANGGVGLS
jgi:O-antigen/teichoic acid export membrane protein